MCSNKGSVKILFPHQMQKSALSLTFRVAFSKSFFEQSNIFGFQNN